MKKVLFFAVCVVATLPLAVAQTGAPGWGSTRWVWDQADAHSVPQSDDPRYLRRTFELGSTAAKATLWITCDNEYTVYVNGQKVGHGTEWSKVDSYEVVTH